MRQPVYLVQRPSGFYFRLSVPPDLRVMIGMREIVRSVRTPSRRQALVRCRRAAHAARSAFLQLRRMETKTFSLAEFRRLLLDRIEAELEACDVRTARMTREEREAYDLATDAELDTICLAVEAGATHPEGDALAEDVLRGVGLSLESLPDDQRAAIRMESVAAIGELIAMRSESATDTTRAFPQRAEILVRRRALAAAPIAVNASPSASADAARIARATMRQAQGLDVEAGSKTVDELFDDYYKAHRNEWKDWESRISRDYRPVLEVFKQVTKGATVGDLTLAHTREYAQLLQDIGPGKKWKSGTIKKKLDFLAAVLRWAHKAGLVPDLTGPLQGKREPDSYEPYTPQELRELFESRQYQTNGFRRAAQFWLPLLGLCIGARIEELAGARLDQIQEQLDETSVPPRTVPGLLLSPEGKKTGKNAHSRRFVPFHSVLIKAGFLDYVGTLRNEGHEFLFPDLPDAKRDGKGKAASRDFQDYRRALGIGAAEGSGRGTKTFHSFRKNLITGMKKAGIDGELRRAIAGHAPSDVHDEVYALGELPVGQRLRAIESVTFDFAVPRWCDTAAYKFARQTQRASPRHLVSRPVTAGTVLPRPIIAIEKSRGTHMRPPCSDQAISETELESALSDETDDRIV